MWIRAEKQRSDNEQINQNDNLAVRQNDSKREPVTTRENTIRLQRALSSLEAAVNRFVVLQQQMNVIKSGVQDINDDRSRLTRKLDNAETTISNLQQVNRDVSQRMVQAMESIRTITVKQKSH